jgi:hypothetical protein
MHQEPEGPVFPGVGAKREYVFVQLLNMNFLVLACFILASSCAYAQTGQVTIEEYLDHSFTKWPFEGAELRLGDSEILLAYNDTSSCYVGMELSAGNYTLRYKTLFQQQLQIEFQHDGISASTIQVFYDDFREDSSLFVLSRNLAVADTFSIKYFGYGCEPYDGGVFSLIKLGEHNYQATFEQDDKKWNRKKLTPLHLKKIATFERQVRSLSSNHAGSMTYCYEIRLNSKIVFNLKYAEGYRRGMAELRLQIFGK